MAKNLKFEEAMARLEEIVDAMESGDVELEKSLRLFEEGIRLVRQCSTKLEETRRKVEVLVEKSGAMTAEPFASPSGDDRSDRDDE